jgi:fructokinase
MRNGKIICFGEMLWDVFPSIKRAGGAPMNVALHLHRLGSNVSFVSRVGNDQLGRELLDVLSTFQLDLNGIQEDESYVTSTVIVNMEDTENIKYEISKPVAWDHISYHAIAPDILRNVECLVYGSLVARSEISRETLFRILEHDIELTVFDLNLRKPFYSRSLIEQLMNKAMVVKMNEEELEILQLWYKLSNSMNEAIIQLSKQFGLKALCVTLGGKGALLYQGQNMYQHEGYKVKVADTVGAGDAFLAAFIYGYRSGMKGEELLDFASALGALVASKSGANPMYTFEELKDFQKGSQKN